MLAADGGSKADIRALHTKRLPLHSLTQYPISARGQKSGRVGAFSRTTLQLNLPPRGDPTDGSTRQSSMSNDTDLRGIAARRAARTVPLVFQDTPLDQNQLAETGYDKPPTRLLFYSMSGHDGNANRSRYRVVPSFWCQRARVTSLRHWLDLLRSHRDHHREEAAFSQRLELENVRHRPPIFGPALAS